MPLSEIRALEILREELHQTYQVGARGVVRLGIGDDAAILAPPSGQQVWTIDSCAEGSHFLWEWMSPEDIAQKAFHAALSDIPAMGAVGVAALCQLTLSPRVHSGWLRRFARAQRELSQSAKVPIVGGNFCMGESVEVSVSVLGSVSAGGSLRRDGSRPGDEIWLMGEVGMARAGLKLLQLGQQKSRAEASLAALRAFRRPHAQLRMGPRLVGRATACLDLSDGLAGDAAHLARASRVRLCIKQEALSRCLSPHLTTLAPRVKESPLELALQGGEDYALLATGPRARRPRGVDVIGRVEEGEGVVLSSIGRQRKLAGGYEHGA